MLEALTVRPVGLRAASVSSALPSPLRRRLSIAAEVGLIASFVAIRSAGLADLVPAWVLAASLVAFLSPVSGLVVLTAAAPFPDNYREPRPGLTDMNGLLSPYYYRFDLTVALLLGLGLRSWRGTGLTPRLAFLFLGWTAVTLPLAMVVDREVLPNAMRQWAILLMIWGILPAAVWCAVRGEVRPLLAGLVGLAAALLVTVIGHLSLIGVLPADILYGPPFGWTVLRPSVPRAPGPQPLPNGLSLLLGILALSGLAFSLRPPRVERRAELFVRVLGGAAFLLGGLVVALTFSRSGVLAFAAGTLLILARVSRRAFLVALLAAVVAAPVAYYVYVNERVVGDQQAGLQGVEENDADRFASVLAGVRMGTERPLTGYGFGSFLVLREAYGSPDALRIHNDAVRLFGETGVPGVALWIAMWLVAGRALWRGGDGAALAGLGAGTVILLMGLVQPLLIYRFGLVSGLLIVGFGVGRSLRERHAVPDPPTG